METILGSIYDHPNYYDVLFGADWKSEYDFLLGCFDKHARRPVKRLFEPACGTGRLLVRFGQAGFEVAGNDLNPHAVAFCNARLSRHGLSPSAEVGDMSDFRLRRKVDAAFNTINSFRHLPNEKKAEQHLRCVAEALGKGGIYALGLHLTPHGAQECVSESWSARRGSLKVDSRMWTLDVDRRRRQERVAMVFDVRTPSRQLELRDEFIFRTYTAAQMLRLLERIETFQLVETYDFSYRLDEPVELDEDTEDVVFILQKR